MSVLLFDAGGVLIELGPPPLKAEWAPGRTLADTWTDWLSMEAARDFESGRTDSAEFAAAMIGALKLDTDADTFLGAFEAWPVAPFPGTVEWLQGLAAHHRLAMLSNTNELHWQRMRTEMGLGDVMQDYFLSHRLGRVKPDQGIYHDVVERLGVPVSDIVFFDDNIRNVEAARKIGIDARHVVGPEAVRAEVATLAPSHN